MTRTIASFDIGDKVVMTVLTENGTRQIELPEERRHEPVLNEQQALELARIGMDIEALYGGSMDIEWAMRGDQVYVLQARPITTSPRDPWNDSRLGDYLWTSGNLGEAVPDVMTPCTWSLMQRVSTEAMANFSLPDSPTVGNIGGRPYMNVSLLATLAAAFGASDRFASATEEVFGRLPEGVDVPLLRVSRWQIIRAIVPTIVGITWLVQTRKGRIAAFVARAPQHCAVLKQRSGSTSSTQELARIWREELEVLFREACHVLQVAGRQGGGALVTTRARLLWGATEDRPADPAHPRWPDGKCRPFPGRRGCCWESARRAISPGWSCQSRKRLGPNRRASDPTRLRIPRQVRSYHAIPSVLPQAAAC